MPVCRGGWANQVIGKLPVELVLVWAAL